VPLFGFHLTIAIATTSFFIFLRLLFSNRCAKFASPYFSAKTHLAILANMTKWHIISLTICHIEVKNGKDS